MVCSTHKELITDWLKALFGFRGNGVKVPRGNDSSYMGSVKSLKEYFDHVYGGVDNYILKLMAV